VIRYLIENSLSSGIRDYALSGWTAPRTFFPSTFCARWLQRKELFDESGGVVRILFREKVSTTTDVVDFLRQFSEKKKNATPVQISLAWLLAQKPFIVPIPGTRSADHLHENLRAVDVQLTPADLREIETALSKIEVHGGRMNEERMKVVDQTE